MSYDFATQQNNRTRNLFKSTLQNKDVSSLLNRNMKQKKILNDINYV